MAREETLVPSLTNAKGMLGIIPFSREVGEPKFPPWWSKGGKNLPPLSVIKRERRGKFLFPQVSAN